MRSAINADCSIDLYMYMYFYEDLIFPSYENNFRNILVLPYINIINHQNVVYQKYPYTFHIIK